MKDQYFGDFGDYKKFSLLRTLSEHKTAYKIKVCWMKTLDDGSNDGRFINYLKAPSLWESYDKDIYHFLRNAVLIDKRRSLSIIEESDLLSNVSFHSQILNDSADTRPDFFTTLWDNSRGNQMIFFDPDNGMEVKSIKYGKKGSKKFLYESEIIEAFNNNFGLMIYQHFPRKERNQYIRDLSLRLISLTETSIVYAVRSRHAVFFIIPTINQIRDIYEKLERFSLIWKDNVLITQHELNSVKVIEKSSQLNLF